jgi:hypothetical protein
MVDVPRKISGTFADLQNQKKDRIGRKKLCYVGGAPFCNTMLNDGVWETASALSPNKIISF